MVNSSDNGVQFEVVFILEATANMVSHWDTVKKNYVLPALNYFAEKTNAKSELINCNQVVNYGLVLFHAADRSPEAATQCLPPTTNVQSFLKTLDSIEFMGGGGEHYCHVTEGLATALQYFADLKACRRSKTAESYCFLISNSPPYKINCVESFEYAGCSLAQIVEKFSESNIKLSIICPRHISEIQHLYVAACKTQSVLMNYAQDRRHLVLISGFLLPTERDPFPIIDTEEQPPEPNIADSTPMDIPVGLDNIANNIPIEEASTISGPNPSGTHVMAGHQNIFQPPVSIPPATNLVERQPMEISTSLQSSSASLTIHPQRPTLDTQVVLPGTRASIAPIVDQPSKSTLINDSNTSNPEYFAAKQEAEKIVQIAKIATNEPKLIWSGMLEWNEKRKTTNLQTPYTKIPHTMQCQIYQQPTNPPQPDVNTSAWPQKLSLQFLPTNHIVKVQEFLKPRRTLIFVFQHNNVVQLSATMKNQCGLVTLEPRSNGEAKHAIMFCSKAKDEKTCQFQGLMPINSAPLITALSSNIRSEVEHNKQREQHAPHQPQPSYQPPSVQPFSVHRPSYGMPEMQQPGMVSNVVGGMSNNMPQQRPITSGVVNRMVTVPITSQPIRHMQQPSRPVSVQNLSNMRSIQAQRNIQINAINSTSMSLGINTGSVVSSNLQQMTPNSIISQGNTKSNVQSRMTITQGQGANRLNMHDPALRHLLHADNSQTSTMNISQRPSIGMPQSTNVQQQMQQNYMQQQHPNNAMQNMQNTRRY